MPELAREIKHHPSAVDLELIKRKIVITKFTTLQVTYAKKCPPTSPPLPPPSPLLPSLRFSPSISLLPYSIAAISSSDPGCILYTMEAAAADKEARSSVASCRTCCCRCRICRRASWPTSSA